MKRKKIKSQFQFSDKVISTVLNKDNEVIGTVLNKGDEVISTTLDEDAGFISDTPPSGFVGAEHWQTAKDLQSKIDGNKANIQLLLKFEGEPITKGMKTIEEYELEILKLERKLYKGEREWLDLQIRIAESHQRGGRPKNEERDTLIYELSLSFESRRLIGKRIHDLCETKLKKKDTYSRKEKALLKEIFDMPEKDVRAIANQLFKEKK